MRLFVGLFTLCVLPSEKEFKENEDDEVAIMVSDVNSEDENQIPNVR